MELSRLLLQSGDNIPFYEKDGVQYCIKNPKLIDIINLDKKQESLYFRYSYLLTNTVLDFADILYMEQNIWYEDIDDWEFFLQNVVSSGEEVSVLSIKDNSDSKIELVNKTIKINKDYTDALNFFFETSGEYVLWKHNSNPEDKSYNNIFIINVNELNYLYDKCYIYNDKNLKINAHNYKIMLDILTKINWIKKDYEFMHGGNKHAKKYILKYDYKKRNKKKKEDNYVDLSSMVSSLVVKGQKYDDVLNYSIYLIYELYYRLRKVDEWNNTMMALSNGNIDTKKNPIKWEKIDWSSVINT